MTLPTHIQQTINALEAHGFEAYAVGGAVRDFLLNKELSDWDIATSALPQNVMEIFGEENCIPTGIKHGTVTYIAENQILEITTYRIDGEYLDNRHPETVTFSSNISDDLSRRDFTVNAMAYNPKAGIIDPFGGQNDLSAGIIRTVGNPDKRFCEDGLRIMRGLRFAATLGFEIEPETTAAIHQCRHLLRSIARERVSAELSKLVMANDPESILTGFGDIFEEIFELNGDFDQSQWAINSKLVCRCPHTLAVRLAILLNGISQNTLPHQILKALRYDNKTICAVKTISGFIDLEIIPDPIFVKHLLSQLGETALRLVLETKKAKFPNSLPTSDAVGEVLSKIISTKQCYLQKDLAIDGNDLIKLGVSGAEIGRILKMLLNEVIEERCENKKPALTELAKIFM